MSRGGYPIGGGSGGGTVDQTARDAAANALTVGSFGRATYDIRSYGQINNAANFTAAVNAWLTAMGTPTLMQRLFIPNGTYTAVKTYTDSAHNVSGAFQWGSNLGLIGESELGTTIQSPADATPFLAAYGSSQLHDIEFSNFTLDCTPQTSGAYTTQLKGMFMQDILRLHIHDVTFRGSWGTSLGCDALVDYNLHDLTFYNPGRGIAATGISDPSTVSGGSAIGIGTGKYASEPGLIHDVIVHDAGRCAIFYEKQSSYSYYSTGHVALGITAVNCWAGLQDCGADGLDATLSVRDSRYGAVLDSSILSSQAGRNANIKLKSENQSIADVLLGNNSSGGHSIRVSSQSGTAGIISRAGVTIGPKITLTLDDIDNHTGPAVNIVSPANVIQDLTITGRARGNGLGVQIQASTKNLHLNVDTSDSRATPASSSGYYLKDATTTHTMPSIKGDIRGNVTPQSFEAALVGAVFGVDTYDVTTPTGLTATSGDGQVSLAWTAPSTVTPTDYAVQYKLTSGSTWTTVTRTASTATTQVVTGLTNGSAYNFRLASIVGGTTGANSAIATTTPAAAGSFTNTTAPAITGTAQTGNTMSVTDGNYSSTPDSTSRQWYRAGTAISGATAPTYVLVSADVGQAITVIVTAVKAGYTTLNTTSNTVTPTAPGATPIISDSFNRTNASSLGSTDGGSLASQAWAITASTGWSTTGTAAKTISGGLSVATVDAGVSNGRVGMRLGALNSTVGSRIADLVFRYQDDSNYYLIAPRASSGDGTWTLTKRVGGTNTVMQVMTGLVAAAGDLVEVVLNGSTITVYVNGTQGYTGSDSSFSGTKHGFRGLFTTDTVSTIDSFSVAAS